MMGQKRTSPIESFGKFQTNPWHIAISGAGSFLIATIVFRSTKLSLPFSLIGIFIPVIRIHRKNEKRSAFLATVWPELLDHMISGLRAGLSIAETLCSLATRGPQESREIFVEAEVMLREGVDLSAVFSWMKGVFNNPIADQVCEVLDFARDTGSRDTSQTLRTLGDFIRSDIAVRGEVEAKLGWVKNSALVAAIAPWILLLILSAQPTTVAAFSTPTGFAILAIGVALSVIAYFWMGKVGNIAQIPRIFVEIDTPKNKPGPNSRVLENIGVRKIVSPQRLRDRTDYGNA